MENPFNDFYMEYDEWYESNRLIYESELRAVEKASTRVPRPWLEIGVGSGRFSSPLRIDVGIDPSERIISLAYERGVESVVGVGEELPFRDSCFGGVFIIVTLCFVDNPLRVLKESWRVLRDDGYVIVGFVPRESPWGRLYVEKKAKGHRFYRLARFYSVSEVYEMLEASGFKTVSVVSTLLQGPGDVRFAETPVEGYVEGAGFVVVKAGKKHAL